MARLLIIDDEKYICNAIKEILEHEKFIADIATSATDALSLIKKVDYDLILTDNIMPEMSGIELFKYLRSTGNEIPIIFMSAHGDIPTAVGCVQMGGIDFLVKPLDLNKMLSVIRNCLVSSGPGNKNVSKVSKPNATRIRNSSVHKYDMIGNSTPIAKLRDCIDIIAKSNARVLITGANGTGKEILARQIHANSDLADKPFIEVNCAAIPNDLIESELFGHEKGAFTSAIKQHKGKFEQANGGTIFLDEIGDMSLAAQSKVLRCLQEEVITPVGGDKQIYIDVRVISATNKNLKEEIKKGTFREDLYHRLNVINVNLPPLSERLDDIPLLVEHFNDMISITKNKTKLIFSDESIKEMQKNTWDGNIRELRNIIERIIVFHKDPQVPVSAQETTNAILGLI